MASSAHLAAHDAALVLDGGLALSAAGDVQASGRAFGLEARAPPH